MSLNFVINTGKYSIITWIGMESKKGWEKTCVCLKRTQRKKLKRSMQTTYLSLVGGSDTTTHHIFRICPAPPATHGWRIFPLLWPFPSWKATLKKSMRKKKYKKNNIYIYIYYNLPHPSDSIKTWPFLHKLINSKNDIVICQSVPSRCVPKKPPG